MLHIMGMKTGLSDESGPVTQQVTKCKIKIEWGMSLHGCISKRDLG